MTRSFRVIQYDTSHYSSLRPETKELQLLLEQNSLPKVNRMMHDVFRVLARREKNEFGKYEVKVGETVKIFDTEEEAKKFIKEGKWEKGKTPTIKKIAHDIKELVAEFSKQEVRFPEQVKNITNFLEELNVEQIVTPVRKVSDFITEDLVVTNPSFLGELLPRYQRLDNEHKKITNTPVKGTGGMIKIALIVVMSIAIVLGLAYAAGEGMFDGIFDFADNLGTIGEGLDGLPTIGGGFVPPSTSDYSDASIQARYTPETLKAAINNGEVDYNKLSATMKQLVDSVEVEEPIAP